MSVVALSGCCKDERLDVISELSQFVRLFDLFQFLTML